MSFHVFLIAGEPSGDKLGAALMAGLKSLVPEIRFTGVGGPLMQAEGLSSLFPMDELSVMGIAEVLPKYRALKRRIAETAQAVLDETPDVLVTIDSPDFCLRVAKIVKAARAQKIVHYVAPSVWAWRPGRADKMAKVVDEVLCLLPFEPPYMTRAGMQAHFVGHPVVAEPEASADAAVAFRAAHGLAAEAPLILALPGSRRGEVGRLAERFGAALRPVLEAHPKARVVVVPATPVRDMVAEAMRDWPGDPILTSGSDPDEKRAVFAAADLALAASGTVSLELAAAGTPMVIAYDMNWLSRILIGRLLRIDTVTLVNLVSETRTIPECLGKDCTPEAIANALSSLLDDTEARAAQIAAMTETMTRLGRGGEAPGLRAARAVSQAVGR
ncbi:lipid-A-disaccharide synthase [Dinoroseobacter sp. S375]|uniref:lipid-A-disaccharide synthase n=1 Tax=Dinoroseobacter sp. S375 TaxID=3415136 RepID=UPI003C7D44F6